MFGCRGPSYWSYSLSYKEGLETFLFSNGSFLGCVSLKVSSNCYNCHYSSNHEWTARRQKQIQHEDDQIINQSENEPESVTNQNECSHPKLLADSNEILTYKKRNITMQEIS